jgi:hypothetical protein
MELEVECAVINQLQIDFGDFTCNLLVSDFVRLILIVPKPNWLFGQEVICISTYLLTNQLPIRAVFKKVWLIPVTVWSKAWVCSCSLAGIVSPNPAGGMVVCSCECCVLSGRSLCVRPITHPEESYGSVVCECDGETSIMRRPWPIRGCCATGGGFKNFECVVQYVQ